MSGPRLVHAIAHCQECDWEARCDFWKVSQQARYHHKKTGHIVMLELGYAKTYGG